MAHGAGTRIVYARNQLLALWSSAGSPRDTHVIPPELFCKTSRGCRAGKKLQEKRRRFRPAVPSVTMGNLRSICNKADELSALTRHQREYRDSCLLIFSESWLTPDIPDSAVTMDNFHLLRADRTADRTADSGKRQGGDGVNLNTLQLRSDTVIRTLNCLLLVCGHTICHGSLYMLL